MFVIDLSSIYLSLNKFLNQLIEDFSGASPYEVAWLFLFKYWGWLIIIYIFLRFLVYPEYMLYIQNKWFAKNIKMTLLAIDVPKRNEQSIQAMENFFDHLLGAHGTFTKWGKYIEGEFQLSFSCELVSIEGNIQFLIRTPSHWRNLVEAAVYSQFPDAEITEVNDYVHSIPRWYPNETHDLWGCEFTLSNKNVYLPIKTYPKFEHHFSETFVDPMAALLETMSHIGKGEQIWIQILIKPLPVDWGLEGGRKEINKILNIKSPAKKGIVSNIIEAGASLISDFTEQLAGIGLTAAPNEAKKEEQPFKMLNLTPAQKEQIEAIEHKISKLAFNTKIRYIYVAEKDKMNKAIGVNGMIGAIKQWNDMNLNGLKPDLKATGTNSPQYIFIEYRRNSRKNWLLNGYIKRDTVRGSPAKPLSSEELASLWHFPSMYVKAPLLKKTEFTKVAAPVGLPIEERPIKITGAKKLEEVLAEKTQVIPTFDYDSDQFEMQFAKDKEAFKKSRPKRKKELKEIGKEEEKKLNEIKKAEEKKIEESKKKHDFDVKKPSMAKENIPGNLPFVD